MAKIPVYTRQEFGANGNALPGGSMEAVRLAGSMGQNIQTAGNALIQTGEILGQFAAKQREAQDVIDRQKADADASVQLEEIFLKNKAEVNDPDLFKSNVETESKEALDRIAGNYSGNVSKALQADNAMQMAKVKVRALHEAVRKTSDSGQAVLIQQEEILTNQALVDFQGGANPNASRDAIAKYNTLVAEQVKAGAIDINDAAIKTQKFRNDVTWKTFQQAVSLNPTVIAESIDSAIKVYDLSPQQAIQARTLADNYRNAERSKYDNLRNGNIEKIITDGVGIQGFEEKAQIVFGKDYKAVGEEIASAKALYPVAQQLKILPESEIKKLLDKHNPLNNPVGVNFDADIKSFSVLQAAAAKEIAVRNRDSFAAVIDDVPQNTDYQIVLDDALARQRNMGIVDAKVMSEQERDGFVYNYVNGLSATDRITAMSKLQAKYGRHTSKAVSEMVAKGLPVEATLMTEVNPQVAMWLGETSVMKVPELKQMLGDDKNANNIMRETIKQYQEQFGKTIIPSNIKQSQNYAEAVSKLSLLYASKGYKNPSGRAVSDLYGQYNYAGTLRVPMGYEKAKITSFAHYMMNEGIQKDLDKIDTGGIVPDLWLARLQSNGEWYVNENEDGMVLYNEGVPVMTKKGYVVEFPFSVAQSMEKKQVGIDIAGYPIEQVTAGAGVE